MKLAVLLTTFNRCQQTLRCLEALSLAGEHAGLNQSTLSIYLVDDASSDGTPEQVLQRYPHVRLMGGGDLYWCRGMHRAFDAALSDGFDAYLWLNDDTELEALALQKLLAGLAAQQSQYGAGQIVVGSTHDPILQRLSYGGERQVAWWRPLTLRLVSPSDEMQRIDSMNGNIVLIDAKAAATVGNLDPGFAHAMGDTDYGLRAKRLGIGLWLAPGFHGSCGLNTVHGSFNDRSMGLGQRWRLMQSRKGLPWRSWLLLTRRHTSWAWPVFFSWPYLRLLMSTLRPRSTGHSA
jgi:GT2 family glycosyltransferase